MTDSQEPSACDATTFHATDSPAGGSAEAIADHDVGDSLGRFVLEAVLGRGGMGQVFAARDAETGERVALKLLTRTTPTQRTRFKREFRALADVEHPNLVRFGELVIAEQPDAPSYFTMELLDGVALTTWLRAELGPAGVPTFDRVRAAFVQLLDGLERLHGAGYIHRDLKPSNVLVTREGRVVLLDFGVISQLREGQRGTEGTIVGTPLYMAPEQAGGQPVGPAADLYALGVMLYEAFVGEPPFTGPVLRVLVTKQQQDAPDPHAGAPAMPPILRECCRGLLEREPARRLDLAGLRSRLGRGPRNAPRPSASALPFVGREPELAVLTAALDEVARDHVPVTVHLRGPGGVGKSALLDQFEARARDRALGPAGAVLRGRCRVRESVPYKGVDALIDALALHLRSLPEPALDELCPRHAEALVQVFSSFSGLWPRPAPAPELEPQEARGLGWAALRELLVGLARTSVLVLIIDDLQWTDPDSVALLRELTRGADAPPVLLVIATREQLASLAARAWLDACEPRHRVALGPLPETEAEALALALLSAGRPDPGVPLAAADPLRQRAAALALRAGGSPLFLTQLATHKGSTPGEDLQLGELVVRRLGRLRGPSRAALEIVAIAGGPIPQARVIELEPGVDPAALDELCHDGLLVRSERTNQAIEVAHDRIREIILAELSDARRLALHWSLGEALLAAANHGREAEAIGDVVFDIVSHLAAGAAATLPLEPARRAELAALFRVAGRRSARAGAWAIARRSYGVGVDLVRPWLELAASQPREPGEPPGVRALCFDLCFGHAEALGMLGEAEAEAAFTSLLAWSLSATERGVVAARWAAILSWANRLDDSLEIGFGELARLGLALPREPSLARGLSEILRAWRSLGRRELDALLALAPLRDPTVRAQLDVLLELGFVASYVDPQLMLTLTGIAVRTMGRHGYHEGMMRSLNQLALALNALGWSRRAASLSDRALAIGERNGLGPTEMIRTRIVAESMIWPASRPLRVLLQDAERRYFDACDLNRGFEAEYFSIAAGFYLFELDRPLVEIAALFERFDERNPRAAEGVNTLGLELIRRNIETLREGRPPLRADETRAGIPFLRYLGYSLELSAAVMFGDYEQATRRMDTMPDDYEQIMLGVPQIPRYAMHCALLEAQRCPPRGLARARCLARLRKRLRTVERWAREGPANFEPMAAIVRGELARLRGRDERARVAFEEATRGASDARAANLLGLALRRRAALEAGRGERERAEASVAEAIAVYEAWGALAVAARLREAGLGAC